jgi:hypothetical protein
MTLQWLKILIYEMKHHVIFFVYYASTLCDAHCYDNEFEERRKEFDENYEPFFTEFSRIDLSSRT